ncbi:HupE/UreJ family protein [Cyanobium sp. Alchichica 3B3-8F6]|uniref:HupE/UreJ family protein n=1 Tax=Cyanobium sp. Alchichica 3B3-8F6 TaxID=2823696 RepID=UPI0020CCFDB5|nr:HupE/UreJ family protein [Cyanobium sp. Alchichica 3B3-8F6]MCP9883220.1 HupE/UreJ family protein [Cyanobium sp. Alchichica 3B3-8F6]
MPPSSLRQLAPAAAAGLALSLLSALPAGGHGLASGGLVAGASHPLLGVDHLLLLVGVGGAAALAGPSLLLVSLAAAVVGSLFGAFGGSLPAAEVLAALTVSGIGLALLARQRSHQLDGQGVLTVVLAVGVAVHAMLHGQEAGGSASELLGWWIGAALASTAVVGTTFAVLRKSKPAWGLALAAGLTLGGGLLALAPLV